MQIDHALVKLEDFLISQGFAVNFKNQILESKWRYFRKTHLSNSEIEELPIDAHPLDWLPNFYALPAHVSLNSHPAHAKGEIIGLDAASGYAVHVLQLQPGYRVLDLCCAPGGKLCLAAELVGPSGSVVGVDVSISRMDVCRKIVRKQKHENIGLLVADGRDDLSAAVLPKMGGRWNNFKMPHDLIRKRKRRKQYEMTGNDRQVAQAVLGMDGDSFSFDSVIVDAECTHDGSWRHLQKFEEQWGWETFERRVMDIDRISNLTDLQYQLLCNGFKYLKPGGRLIYSTCSLSPAQNINVVDRFLANEAAARAVRVPLAGGCERVGRGAQFWPGVTSGLFAALISRTSFTEN